MRTRSKSCEQGKEKRKHGATDEQSVDLTYSLVCDMFKPLEDFTPIDSPDRDLYRSFEGDVFRKGTSKTP